MSVSEQQARIRAKVWQGVAQSGVDVSGIAQADMDKLVGTISEAVLGEVDALLSDASGVPSSQTPATPTMHGDEQVLWEGRPFLSLSVRYQITTERVRIVEGIMGKDREDIELVRVQDLDQTQSFGERMFNVGDIHVRSHDPSSPEIVLNNVPNPQEVHEILRRAVLAARDKYRVSYREEM